MKRMMLALLLAVPAAVALASDEPNEAQEQGGVVTAREAVPEAERTPTAPPPSDPLDRTMQELMELRNNTADAPAVDPVQRPDVEYVPSRVGAPSVTVDIDRSVLGVAPGQPRPTLRREGEFIVNRRGRLVRSPDGAHVLFAFESDSQSAQEPPMVVQACRNLEAMENYVVDRGDAAVFIVSGQVHAYRGANYLLPTMWKLAQDQGNLQP